MKRFYEAIIGFILIFTIVNGCKNTQDNPVASLELNDAMPIQQGQINSFDPLDAYHAGHIQMVKQLFNSLTDVDIQGNIVPSLAQSWHTDNGLQWTFNLRKDALFTDDSCFKDKSERTFVAQDVKYTFERLLNKDSKSLGAPYFSNIKGIEEFTKGASPTLSGIVVKDDHTIVFELNEQDYNFPNLLALPYASIVKKRGIECYKNDFKIRPIGTGPFKLEKYEANKQVVFAKNNDYWEKDNSNRLPYIDKITIQLTSDDNLAMLLFKNQKSNFLELNLPIQQQIENIALPFEYKKDILEWTQLNFYLFNLNTVKDKNVRLGINYAMNREELQRIIKDQGVVTQSLYPSIFNELIKPNAILTFSPEKAKTLLTQKRTLKLVCFEDILSRALAEFMANQLKPYSIETTIESVTFPVLVERLTKGDYDMIQIYWGPLYADVNHFLTPFKTSSFPPAGNNFNQFSNSEFDKIVNETQKMPQDKQQEQYLKAQEIILNDMPFFLAFYKNTIRASNGKFTMPLHPLGYRFYKYAKKN